jgi:FkbM family methyltransferase
MRGVLADKQLTVPINGRPYLIRYPGVHSIDYMVEEIFVKRVYPPLPLPPGQVRVILDVGANIGCSCVWFRALYPGAAIFALEPDRQAFLYLQANTASLGDVRLFNCGLHDRDGAAKLYQGKGTSTTNSLSPNVHNTSAYAEVALRRASSFVAEQGLERISLLKVDTEGAEVPILRDLEAFLERVDAVMLEYHSERDRLEVDHLLSQHARLHRLRRRTVPRRRRSLGESRPGRQLRHRQLHVDPDQIRRFPWGTGVGPSAPGQEHQSRQPARPSRPFDQRRQGQQVRLLRRPGHRQDHDLPPR